MYKRIFLIASALLLIGCLSIYGLSADGFGTTHSQNKDKKSAPVKICGDISSDIDLPEKHETVTVTFEQLSEIPANTSYGDILAALGETNAYGQSFYRQYFTDDKRLIPLCFAKKSDLCPYSGEELYNRAIPLEYDGEIPDGMIYGVITDGKDFPRLFIHYMIYVNVNEGKLGIYKDQNGEPIIEPDFIFGISEAEIVFEDGTPATEDDLKHGIPVLVESDYVLECAPGRMHCTKIVILK